MILQNSSINKSMFPNFSHHAKYNKQLKKNSKSYLFPKLKGKSSPNSFIKNSISELDRSVQLNKQNLKIYQLKKDKKHETRHFINTQQKIKREEEDRYEIQEQKRKVNIYTMVTELKPPHRYSTHELIVGTQMIIHKNHIILYGGLGCQKNLTWAKFSLLNETWEFPKPQIKQKLNYYPNVPVFGHSFVQYKGKGIIFGGVNVDDSNQLSFLDFKTMKYKSGTKSPFRRRYHASGILFKFMIVHGGIQVRQTKSQILLYDIEKNQWFSPILVNLPALSHHKFVNPFENKKIKKNKLSQESLYMFGGLNEKGVAKNRMYRIRINNENEISCQKISTKCAPAGRHSFAFESVDTNTLMIYGGKSDQQLNGSQVTNGIFCDFYLYNIETSTFVKPTLPFDLDYRFGMSSASNGNKIYIFGGSLKYTYANADISVFTFNRDDRYDITTSLNLPTMNKIL